MNENLDSHPLNTFLYNRDGTGKVTPLARETLRRVFDALAQPPENVEAWFREQIAAYVERAKNELRAAEEKAARDLEARQYAKQKAKEARELARRQSLPRRPKWQLSAAAARRLHLPPERELHPGDVQAIAEEARVIAAKRAVRASNKKKTDPLDLWRGRYRCAIARRLVIRVGGLRRRKALDAYGRLLLALWDAQEASDRAKSRAAHRIHFDDYCSRRDGSRYARRNYRRSQCARDMDYFRKERCITRAIGLSREANVRCGYREYEEHPVPFVIYFDLPTGQVGFHAEQRLRARRYSGEWDGKKESATRIEAALWQYLHEHRLTTKPRRRRLGRNVSSWKPGELALLR